MIAFVKCDSIDKCNKTIHKLFTPSEAIDNKAIRDGKYLAPPHASAWQNSPPLKSKCFDIFFVTSFVCSLEFLYY